MLTGWKRLKGLPEKMPVLCCLVYLGMKEDGGVGSVLGKGCYGGYHV